MQQALVYLRGLIALIYIVLGFLLVTDVLALRFALGSVKLPFSILLISYGIFRIYKTLKDYKKDL